MSKTNMITLSLNAFHSDIPFFNNININTCVSELHNKMSIDDDGPILNGLTQKKITALQSQT